MKKEDYPFIGTTESAFDKIKKSPFGRKNLKGFIVGFLILFGILCVFFFVLWWF